MHPQVGLEEEEKREFWDFLGHLMVSRLGDEKVVLVEDFNRHIGKKTIIIIIWFMEGI